MSAESMALGLNLLLVFLLLGLASWVIFVRQNLAAVIGFMVFGLLLTLAWARLNGLDVALTEAAIGGGLTGFLLLTAAIHLRSTESAMQKEIPKATTRMLAALFSAGVSVLLAISVLALPSPAPTLAPVVMEQLPAIQVGNPITGVLLAFRAMDTLLEALVLVLALLGVWSLATDAAWGGRPGIFPQQDENSILVYAARILPPIGIIIGGYIFWIGADDPGGKFQGATILAAMWLLVVMSGLRDTPPISHRALRLWIVLGPLIFMLIGVLGSLFAGHFLGYPQGYAKLMIVAVELALLPSLTLVLGLLLMGAPKRSLSA
jgi:multisubunit Na+/H+ antiporter MnhB subunit